MRLFVLLPQLPQDPGSGAARSLSAIAELVAQAGFQSRVLATSASENTHKFDAFQHLRDSWNVQAEVCHPRGRGNRPEWHFGFRGVGYRLLDVGCRTSQDWETDFGPQFDRALDNELTAFRPDVMLTFGVKGAQVRRFDLARSRGTKVVFGLRNDDYLEAGAAFFGRFAGVLTPSQYLTTLYRERIGIESTPIPSPVLPEDSIAPEHERTSFTMVNPAREKGLMLMARLAYELAHRRPDIRLLVVESRGTFSHLVAAGLIGGLDLRKFGHLTSMGSAGPKEIFRRTKALLVPSLGREAFGRVAVEAQMNGLPPLVSNRGGLPESCREAGFVLDIPADIDANYPRPVPAEVVAPWLELITRLEDDADFYSRESERAQRASAAFHPDVLRPQYVDFFQRLP